MASLPKRCLPPPGACPAGHIPPQGRTEGDGAARSHGGCRGRSSEPGCAAPSSAAPTDAAAPEPRSPGPGKESRPWPPARGLRPGGSGRPVLRTHSRAPPEAPSPRAAPSRLRGCNRALTVAMITALEITRELPSRGSPGGGVCLSLAPALPNRTRLRRWTQNTACAPACGLGAGTQVGLGLAGAAFSPLKTAPARPCALRMSLGSRSHLRLPVAGFRLRGARLAQKGSHDAITAHGPP